MLIRRHAMPRLVLLRVAMLCSASGTVAATPVAQQPVHAGPMSAMHSPTSAGVLPAYKPQGDERPVLNRIIALDLRGVSLAAALNDISTRAEIRLLYSSELLPKQVRVTVMNTSISTAEALATVLSGTGLTYRSNASGAVAIVPAVESSANGRRETGVIVGRVLNAKTKQPVPGARVMVGDDSKGVTVGDDGRFRIQAPVGEQRVTVRALGFERQAKAATVGADQIVTLEFALEPSANVLNEVIVTGTVVETERKAISNPITVITAADIEKRGITRIDEFFRGEVPGVIAMEQGAEIYNGSFGWGSQGSPVYGAMQTSRVYVRGASRLSTSSSGTNPLKTYIDGVEILDPAYLGTIDPQSIERIEIVTGPQAATIYGSGAMGGVMQIFTKKGQAGDRVEFSLGLKFGMLESNVGRGATPSHAHSLSATGGSGVGLSYSGTLSYNYTGPWTPKISSQRFGASVGATHTRDRFTTKVSLSTTIGSNGTYDGAYAYTTPLEMARIHSGQWIKNSETTASIGVDRIASSSSQTFSLAMDYRQFASVQHSLVVGMSRTVFRSADNRPGLWAPGDTMYRSGQSSGDRVTVNYHTNMGFSRDWVSTSMTFGFDVSRANRLSASGCQVTKGATFRNCTYNATSLQATAPLDDENYGGFGRMQLGFWEHVYLTLGLRADRNPNYGRERRVNWTPSNGFAYNFSLGDVSVKLLGSYGQATRSPNPEYRLAAIATSSSYEPSQWVSRIENPMLAPEFSRGPQGGIEIYYGGLASLVVNHYQQKITDLIQNAPVDSIGLIYLRDGSTSWSPISQYLNAATIRQFGWETQGSLTLGPLSFKGTHSWNDSRVLKVHPRLASSSSWYPGRGFFGIPTHTANINIGYALGGTSITYSASYIGKYRRHAGTTVWYYDQRYDRLKVYVNTMRPGSSEYDKPAYSKSNLAASHRLRPWLTATVHVTNIADSYKGDAEAIRATLGRQTLIGLQIRPSSRR